jgi:hypothetical protein
LHPTLGLEQPLRPGARNRLCLLSALLIKLMAGLAHPATASLAMTSHRGRIELDRVGRGFRASVLARPGCALGEPALGLAQRRSSSLRRL